MSLFDTKSNKSSSLVRDIGVKIQQRHPFGKANGYAGAIASFESYGNPDLASKIVSSLESNRSDVCEVFGQAAEEASNPTAQAIVNRAKEAGEEAAAIIMEASSNPQAYIHQRTSRPLPAQGGRVLASTSVDTSVGQLAERQGIVAEKDSLYATESFDNTELHKAMPYSTVWNFKAAQQSEFTEALYGTVVITPDMVGYVAEARVQYVYMGMKHTMPNNGNPDAHKRMLIEAYRDTSVLRNEATALVPWYVKDAKGKYATTKTTDTPEAYDPELYFTDPAKIAPKTILLNGASVTTAPFKFGTGPIDLLAISAHPSVTKGQFNETDQLDAALSLSDFYLAVGADKKIVHYPTKGLQYAGFQKSQEGNDRLMNLNFITEEFSLDKGVKDLAQSAITELTNLADYSVRLRVVVKADVNLNTAVLDNVTASVRVSSVKDVDGNEVDFVKDGAVAALVEALELEPYGYYLKGARSNTNYRTQGPIVDTYSYVEKYVVGIRSPLSAQSSISDTSDMDLDTLIALTRARQDADALLTLFDYRDTLKEYIARPINKTVAGTARRVPNFIGLGKYLIEKPYYEFIELDMKKALNSLRSAQRDEDVQAVLVQLIKERVAFMYRETGLFTAHLIDNGGKAVTPHVTIATDSYLSKFLTLQSDTRLLGAGFEASVVVSPFTEMNNRIFVTFTRPEKKDFDALSFGNTLYCPELVTTVSPYNKEGATIRSLTVAPRYAHINNLPILLEIEVKNVSEVYKHLQELYAITKAA